MLKIVVENNTVEQSRKKSCNFFELLILGPRDLASLLVSPGRHSLPVCCARFLYAAFLHNGVTRLHLLGSLSPHHGGRVANYTG
jgi:hypothetical protein